MSEPSAMTGLPDPQLAIHAVGMPATSRSHREAVLLEDVGQVLRRLEFLEAELAEAEHLIVHALDVFAHAVDFEADIFLDLFELRVDGAAAAGAVCCCGAAVSDTVTTVAHAMVDSRETRMKASRMRRL